MGCGAGRVRPIPDTENPTGRPLVPCANAAVQEQSAVLPDSDLGTGNKLQTHRHEECTSFETSDGRPHMQQAERIDIAVQTDAACSDDAPLTEDDWSWCRTVLGRYEVRGADVLGIGNFSVVRRGVDSRSGATVAVKCLKQADDIKFRREVFLFEAITGVAEDSSRRPTLVRSEAGKLSTSVLPRPDEMFVKLLDHSPLQVLAPGDLRYSVLEMGQFTLDELIKQCKDAVRNNRVHCLAQENELLRVLVHVARALAFLHSRLFVHGDIKPANVMWFAEAARGVWKLIDVDGVLTCSEVLDMRHAEFYTPIYAAPEIAQAVATEGYLRISRRVDVWSAGMVILEMDGLAQPLWPKFEELCIDDVEGIIPFMRWLASTPVHYSLPQRPRVASAELLNIVREQMLLAEPAYRVEPAKLLEQPLLVRTEVQNYVANGAHPVLRPPTPPSPPKPRTAWQLYQDAHRAELEREGFKGGKLVQELHKRWKTLLAEGGEELDRLQQQEANLRKAAES